MENEYIDYAICEAHTDEYDAFLICLTHENILNYIEKIQQERLIKEGKGDLLVDQLLVTGNGKNRFLLLGYDHGELDLESADGVEPDPTYRDRAVELLKENIHLIDNSILSDLEMENVKNGVSF